MVLGKLADAGAVDGIGPVVAYIDDGGVPATDQCGHQRGAHAQKLFKLLGLIENSEICQLGGSPEHLVGADLVQ